MHGTPEWRVVLEATWISVVCGIKISQQAVTLGQYLTHTAPGGIPSPQPLDCYPCGGGGC